MKKEMREEILEAVVSLGKPSPIMEIEKRVSVERHTLSKYLSVLKQEGLLEFDSIGRAKLWYINRAPVDALFKTRREHKSFAEKLLSAIIHRMPAGLFIIDTQYKISFSNDIMKEKYGDVEGEELYFALLKEDNPLNLSRLRDVVEGRSDLEDIEVTDQFGDILYIRASSIENPDGSRSVILIVDDITSEAEFQQKLKESEERHRELIETLPDAMLLLTLDMKIKKVNTQALKMLEANTKDDLIGKDFMMFTPEDDREIVFQRRKEMISGKSMQHRTYTLIGMKGKRSYVEVNGCPARDANGKPHGFLILFRDLSDRQEYDKIRARYAAIFENAQEAIIGKELDGTIVSWNKAAEDIYGYSAKEVIGKNISLIVPDEKKTELEKIMSDVRAGKKVNHLNTVRVDKEGNTIDISLSVSPINDPSGKLIGISAIARNISGEKKLEEFKKRYRAQVESSPEGLYVLDTSLKVRFASTSLLQSLGYKHEDVIGKSVLGILPEKEHAQVHAHLQKLYDTGAEELLKYNVIRNDGSFLPVEVNTVMAHDSSGEPTEVIGFVKWEKKKVGPIKT